MKKHNLILFFIAILLVNITALQSCKDEKAIPTTITEITNKELAIEILQEKEKVQFAQSITNSENAEFYNGEIIQKMPQKMRKAILEENTDTITNADEIPIMSAESSTQNIFVDGTYSYISQDKTTEEMRLIEELNLHKQPENEKIAKTIVNNNTVYSYNSSGELIGSETIGEINFKPMLDTLKSYLAEQAISSPSNAPQKIREKSSKMLRQAIAGGMRVISQNANEIVLETDLKNNNSVASTNKMNAPTIKKLVIHYSPDMNRVYSQYIYVGNQLTNSIEMEYAKNNESNLSNKVKSLNSAYFPTSNIKVMRQKTLMMKPDGTPYIKCNQETYTKNQVIYHF